jgi:hypothetical protein
MFFLHRMLNAVTMMYNEADELTACHFIRPSTYWKRHEGGAKDEDEKGTNGSVSPPEYGSSSPPVEESGIAQNEPS